VTSISARARSGVKRVLGTRGVARTKRVVALLLSRDLTRLGRFYGTNKAYPDFMYTPHYEKYLRSRRWQPLRILEIGIGGYSQGTGGSSLRMWRTYFPRAHVFGIDIEPRDLREPRITTYCGSQSDPAFLERVVAEIGAPDVVIDDGSHRSADIITSFETLYPHLASGGLYVIEDLHCSYNPDYGGGPPGSEHTSVELVKDLVDRVAQRRPGVDETAAIHVYPRIAFIEKR